MATEASGNNSGTMDPVEIEYFDWDPGDSPVSIHMHLGAMDGIARDVIEGFGALPRPDLEVGGLLLGRVENRERPEVWIERYQRITCSHRFGPHFILDREDRDALENAAATILESGDLVVVGFYRSQTRPGFQLEVSDFEMMRQYFSDPSDLILLIKADTPTDITGMFHTWDASAGPRVLGGEFPFHGRVVGAEAVPGLNGILAPPAPPPPEPKPMAKAEPKPVENPEPEPLAKAQQPKPAVKPPGPKAAEPGKDDEEDTEATGPSGRRVRAAAAAGRPREIPRRLVPDFNALPVEPAPSVFGLGNPMPEPWQGTPDSAEERGVAVWMKKWLPLLAALLVAGGILWLALQRTRPGAGSTTPTQTVETPPRPLGLYVDTAGPVWRVLWNPSATALHQARSVQLFVREGDDQNRIDLSARDLASGSYQYKPVGNDVTFRLEVVDRAGLVSAESFRLMRLTQPPAAVPPAVAPAPEPPPVQSNAEKAPAKKDARNAQPRAIYRAPPVVAAGIRPRIKGTIAIDVRVRIDSRGHVISAAPVKRQRNGLEEYLAGRAVQAARLWRFEPARENGKAVPGSQTLHFVFEK